MKNAGSAWGASIGAIVGYLAAVMVPQLPGLIFYPRLGAWSLGDIAGEPGIRWYGMILYALAGGLVGMLAGTRLLHGRRSWNLVWITATIAALVLIVHEWGWFTARP